MGFNKRNVDKENVLFYIKNTNIDSLIREMKIDMLFKSDTLLLDSWTSKFYNDLRPKERDIRKKLLDKYKFDSAHSFINDIDYKDLSSLSEALISLSSNNPQWVDIYVVIDKLNIKVHETESGVAEVLRQKCIDAIIKHFDKY